MTSKLRKEPARDHEAHIYMTREEHEALKARAKAECRSVNGQALIYIKRGLEQDAT